MDGMAKKKGQKKHGGTWPSIQARLVTMVMMHIGTKKTVGNRDGMSTARCPEIVGQIGKIPGQIIPGERIRLGLQEKQEGVFGIKELLVQERGVVHMSISGVSIMLGSVHSLFTAVSGVIGRVWTSLVILFGQDHCHCHRHLLQSQDHYHHHQNQHQETEVMRVSGIPGAIGKVRRKKPIKKMRRNCLHQKKRTF